MVLPHWVCQWARLTRILASWLYTSLKYSVAGVEVCMINQVSCAWDVPQLMTDLHNLGMDLSML